MFINISEQLICVKHGFFHLKQKDKEMIKLLIGYSYRVIEPVNNLIIK